VVDILKYYPKKTLTKWDMKVVVERRTILLM
jgi:hypothetical protein